MMDDMGDVWWSHLRIALLRALNDDTGRTCNESMLMDLVNAVLISADRDQVRQALLWLHEQELVVATVVKGSMGATITELGTMVAEGKRTHAGVKRPNVTASVARKALGIALDKLKR
ncbi:ArsR family transcriptional regulator [Roseomonas terrae]|uniref:ArsR family transcriptional regulator n=1 Tax=Neoroseomonas terrae TaxID=424799 RepID=A0ABS5EH69_9PROT|nr:hypothetical protein [Neoroseomonas terrae]MBR0650365.1 ArsR family transcriptional regulator [Neoroseomonas terrae]